MDGAEEIQSGAGAPFADLRRDGGEWDAPVIVEGAEVIDAEDVGLCEARSEAGEPPRVAGFCMRAPLVEWVAPELAGRREVIGWHARDGDGQSGGGVDLEELGRGPGVGAVARDEDRQVADDLDAALPGGGAHERPLAEEEVLVEYVGFDGDGELRGELGLARGGMGAHLGGPFPPGLPVEVVFAGAEKCVGLQPVGVVFAKLGEVAVGERGPAEGDVSGVRFKQQQPFALPELAEIDALVVEGLQRLDVFGREQPEPHERKDVDQVRVACKGGKALVGRIAVAGRAERAHLPVAVAAGFQEIQETLDGAGFEGADALVSRQASGVEKDAAAAFGQPVEQGESRC